MMPQKVLTINDFSAILIECLRVRRALSLMDKVLVFGTSHGGSIPSGRTGKSSVKFAKDTETPRT